MAGDSANNRISSASDRAKARMVGQMIKISGDFRPSRKVPNSLRRTTGVNVPASRDRAATTPRIKPNFDGKFSLFEVAFLMVSGENPLTGLKTRAAFERLLKHFLETGDVFNFLAENDPDCADVLRMALLEIHHVMVRLAAAIKDGELKELPSGLVRATDVAEYLSRLGPLPPFLAGYIGQRGLGAIKYDPADPMMPSEWWQAIDQIIKENQGKLPPKAATCRRLIDLRIAASGRQAERIWAMLPGHLKSIGGRPKRGKAG